MSLTADNILIVYLKVNINNKYAFHAKKVHFVPRLLTNGIKIATIKLDNYFDFCIKNPQI